ncbi:hypothetical protein quinque_001362 [Culex quinquefasciatus]
MEQNNDYLDAAFKEIYDEIDRLSYVPVEGANLEPLDCKIVRKCDDHQRGDFLRDEDVEELLQYSKKFVEQTRNELLPAVGFRDVQEHAVQCVRSEKKCNKKLNTPPKWATSGGQKEAAATNRATAIRIVKKIPPTGGRKKLLDESPGTLNNQRPPSQAKTVRNVGVNVNFIKQKTVKQQNSVVSTATTNVTKTPPVIKKPVTPQSSGRIYRFYSSKLNPEQVWEQQHPELGYESSERSIFPRRLKKSDLLAKQAERPATAEKKELKVVHLTQELVTEEVPDVEPIAQTQPDEQKAASVTPEPVVVEEPELPKTPAITKHVIPTICIKGDWKANLKVQEACRINILDKKQEGDPCPSNLKYLEIRVPKSAPKSTKKGSSTNKASSTNRYLQPFLDLKKCKVTAQPNLFLQSTDSDPSSSDSDQKFVLEFDSSDSSPEDDLTLLHFKCDPSPKKVPNIEASFNELSSVPRLVSPAKSIQLQVPPSPCQLKSPPKTPSSASSIRNVDPVSSQMEASASSKFLENLRIWRSAIAVQSDNMKLGHQLTENLDVLKQNMEVIAGETQNITRITRNCEQNLKQIEGLQQRYRQNMSSPAASNRHLGEGCTCFGCQPASSPAAEPAFDTKNFQRVVLQQSPRYAKTIRKICEDGRSRSFKTSGAGSAVDAERAARRFLQSYSRSVSRISSGEITVPELDLSRSHSPGSVGSWYGVARRSSSSDEESVTSSGSSLGCVKRGDLVGSSSSEMQLNYRARGSSDTSSSEASAFVKGGASMSDEGEVLSQGEIR